VDDDPESVRHVICVDEGAPRIQDRRAGSVYGDIRLMAGSIADQDRWRACDGARMVLAQNQALYSIISDTFGSFDGRTYALPTLPPPAPGLRYVIGVTGQYPRLDGRLHDAELGQTIGEIRPWPSSRVPAGWCPCDGRTLPIREFTATYSVLGWGPGDMQSVAIPRLEPPAPGVQFILCVSGDFPLRWE
jgi:microcystin-dependent protein